MINQEYYLKDDKCYIPQKDCCINDVGEEATDIKVIATPGKKNSVSMYQGENLISHMKSDSLSISKDEESNSVIIESKTLDVIDQGTWD